MITAVAIKVNDKVYSLPRPARHAAEELYSENLW